MVAAWIGGISFFVLADVLLGGWLMVYGFFRPEMGLSSPTRMTEALQVIRRAIKQQSCALKGLSLSGMPIL
jgi:hypothetical protein